MRAIRLAPVAAFVLVLAGGSFVSTRGGFHSIIAPAFAEGAGEDQDAVPVEPGSRLPAVVAAERFLKQSVAPRLREVFAPLAGQPPAPARQSSRPSSQPAPRADDVKRETAATPVPAARSDEAVPPPASAQESAAAPKRQAPRVAEATVVEPGQRTAAPVRAVAKEQPSAAGQEQTTQAFSYASSASNPPMGGNAMMPNLWQRLLASKLFLWFAGLTLIVLPLIGMSWSAFVSQRRQERDLLMFD